MIGDFADRIMPILSNILFLPIISILTSIFICDTESGDNLEDTILAKDCTVHCWTNKHTNYAILVIISLSIYNPSAVFTRPLWQ